MKKILFLLPSFIFSLNSFAQDNTARTIYSSNVRDGHNITFELRDGDTRSGEIDFFSADVLNQNNFRVVLEPGDSIGLDVDVRVFGQDVVNGTDNGTADTASYTATFTLQGGASDVKVVMILDGETEPSSSIEFSIADGGNLVSTEALSLIENTNARILIINTGSSNLSIKTFQLTFAQVISNTNDALAREDGAIIENPVTDGSLQLTLANGVTSAKLELLSLSGEPVMSKHITTSESIDVSSIDAGMYILRDVDTNSTQKVVIQ